MNRLRVILILGIVLVFAVPAVPALAADKPLGPWMQQAEKSKPQKQKSAWQKMAEATGNFFNGIAETLHLKNPPSKRVTASHASGLRKEQPKKGLFDSWFASKDSNSSKR